MFILNPYRYSAPANLLLDTYSGAAAAYSLRKLRTAYSGSSIRVRRSSDNTEQDIGFDGNGNLDESALITFIGYENLFQYSEQFNTAYWNKSNSTVTANTIAAPDTNITADSFIENTSNTDHYVGNINGMTLTNATYTVSAYFKKLNRSFAVIAMYNGTNVLYAWFDILNGTLGTVQSGASATITSVGNDWYRCSMSRTMSTSANNFISFGSASADNVTSFTGNGLTAFYIWGAQLNTGSLQNYQITTSSTRDGMGYVTKWYDQSGNARDAAQTTSANQPRIVNAGTVDKVNNKPSCYFDGSNDGFSTSSFSINSALSLFFVTQTVNLSNDRTFINTNNASSRPFQHYVNTSLNWKEWQSGANINININTQMLLGEIQKSDYKVYMYKNGIAGTTGSNFTSYYGTSSLYIGIAASNGGLGWMNGNMQEIVLYDSDQTSNRSSIESNINSYYSIY